MLKIYYEKEKAMRAIDIIHEKREGRELTEEQIQSFIDGVVSGEWPDYQISALLMAIFLNGMTDQEATTLTLKMRDSGEVLDLSSIPGIKVDKHSTGGVGDKVSLILAPLVASCGVPVPMISGRGLGHTGGTLDKLEAIPGFNVSLSEEAFIEQVKTVGCAIVGATGDIAPADKKIYALRDVTDTVDSIPLIAGSIMSKKLASGSDALIIDVKTGAGAFMKTLPEAEKLARALVDIGKGAGLNCTALITDMNQPLGTKVGNALEMEEVFDTLKGKGPKDLTELTLAISSEMLVMGKVAKDLDEAKEKLEEAIESGKAAQKMREMIKAQGGDERVVDDYDLMPRAHFQIDVKAEKSGVLSQLTADEIGIASMLLGGGRQKANDELDYAVGIKLHKKVGDSVEEGEALMTIFSNKEEIDDSLARIQEAIEISDHADKYKMIYEKVD